ncbi:hypothetical protein, partial [Nocardia salmonicida]
ATAPFTAPGAFERFLNLAVSDLNNAGTNDTVTIRLTPAHHADRATIVTTRAGTTVARTTVDATGQPSTSTAETTDQSKAYQ